MTPEEALAHAIWELTTSVEMASDDVPADEYDWSVRDAEKWAHIVLALKAVQPDPLSVNLVQYEVGVHV